MTDRKLKLGDVMREIGLKPLNASLGNALKGPSRIRPDMAAALELWLDKHEKR